MTAFLGWAVAAIPVLLAVGFLFIPNEEVNPSMNKKLKIWFLIASILYSGMVAMWMRASTADAKIAQHSAEDRVRKAVKEEDASVVVALNTTIGNLSNLVSAQQSQINDIHGSNIVTGNKPVKVVVTNPPPASASTEIPQVRVASVPAPLNTSYGKKAIQFILTTNKTMNGGHVRMTCTNPFNNVSETISGAGVTMGGGRGGKIDDRTYESTINSPNWAPGFPLILTVYYDGENLGNCNFAPIQ
jgi:hypothetical protein